MKILVYDDEDVRDAYEYAIYEVLCKETIVITYIRTFEEFVAIKDNKYDLALIDWQLDFHQDKRLNAFDIIPFLDAERIAIVTGFHDLHERLQYPSIYTKPLMPYHIKALIEK